jgi:hypothetical protein
MKRDWKNIFKSRLEKRKTFEQQPFLKKLFAIV